jgi:hypothetical protein
MTFWGLIFIQKIVYTNWRFLPFGLKNILAEFQKVIDWMLLGLGFAKCYTNDIIIFSLTSKNHMYHLQKVFKTF